MGEHTHILKSLQCRVLSAHGNPSFLSVSFVHLSYFLLSTFYICFYCKLQMYCNRFAFSHQMRLVTFFKRKQNTQLPFFLFVLNNNMITQQSKSVPKITAVIRNKQQTNTSSTVFKALQSKTRSI